MHKDNLEEFNYETTDKCDGCGKSKHGTMLHAHDAMGWATPVLFLCDRCHKPTWYQRRIDTVVNLYKRTINKVKYYCKTTKAERAEQRERTAKMRARLAELRANRA